MSIASQNDTIRIEEDDANILTPVVWRYKIGDNLQWAEVGSEDSTWGLVDAKHGYAGFPLDNW